MGAWAAAFVVGCVTGYVLANAGVLLFALALIVPLRAAGGRVATVIGGLLLGAGLAEAAVYASPSGGVAWFQWLGALLTLAVGVVLTLASVRARSGSRPWRG